jgi:outer membrane protein assembly factor BamA
MRLKYATYLSFLLCLPLFSADLIPEFTVCTAPARLQELETLLPDQAIIQSVTYDSDVQLAESEFNYLMDINLDQPITGKSIKKGIANLYKKNRYEAIAATGKSTASGCTIHLTLTGLWTFKKLKLRGMLMNKEYYRQYYSMESGEPFDLTKHDCAVQKIKEAFAQEGYFGASVESSFIYDYENKHVSVYIALKKGSRFGTGHVHIALQGDGVVAENNKNQILALCNKHFVKRLQASAYSKVLITKETKILTRLLAQNGYSSVDIQLQESADHQRKKIDLNFVLTVHGKKECVFFGNKALSNQDLFELVSQFGQSITLLPPSIIAQEIEQMYHKKGFWHVHIQPQEEAERYIFNIEEGDRGIVREVVLKNISEAHSAELIQTLFVDFLTADFYDAQKLKQALENVYAWYLKKGFWEVKVAKQEFVLIDENEHTYTLIITLDQGNCTYLTSVAIEVNKDIGKHDVLAQLEKKDLHMPFNTELVDSQRNILVDYFKKIGYRNADIKPDIKREGNEVTLVWKIALGQSDITFGKTIIVGSTNIPFERIQRELCYKEGDPWDNNALKKSFLRLKSWQVFQDIHLSPDRVSVQEKEKAVILKLQEDDPYELRLRGGLEMQQVAQFYIPSGLTYKLGGSFILKSPFHRGDQLRIDADFARVYRELALKYQLPWLFDQPIRSEFMVYSNKYLQPGFVGGEKSIYDAVAQGMQAGFNRTFDHVDTGLNVGFEWLKTSIPDRSEHMAHYIDAISRAINFDPRLLNRSVPYFQIEPTVMIDYLNEKRNPTKGSFTLLSLKGMLPLTHAEWDAYFVKALMEQSFFFPIKSWVVATRLRAGHIFFKDFKNVMPMERFYLGGANSLRSYDTDFAPPLGYFLDEKGKRQYVPQGGQSMLNLNFELRFPVYKNLGGVVFQDIGTLSSSRFADFKGKDILLGTGFGVRITTPVGPLRFDIAWKWAREPEARSFAWFLTFGQAF